MGWSIGYDDRLKRDVGYGVPATCDHPECNRKIDRGLAYVCGGEPYGGDEGCGLHFCGHHLWMGKERQLCWQCLNGEGEPFTPKPDRPVWLRHKLKHPSWKQWRCDNPKEVSKLLGTLADAHQTKSPPQREESET